MMKSLQGIRDLSDRGSLTMKPHAEMRHAYQELSTLSMLSLALSIMAVLTALFTLWDPMDLARTLSAVQRLGFSAFVGSSDLVICYSCGVLVLYLSRFRSRHQTLALLAVTALAVAAPCIAIMYAGYTLFHEGRPPGDGILDLYAVNATNLGWTTALIFYVLLLRIGRRNPLAVKDDTAPKRASHDTDDAGLSSDRDSEDSEEMSHPTRADRLRDEGEVLSLARSLAVTVDDERRSADARQSDADAHRDDAPAGRKQRKPVHMRPVEANRLLEFLPETVGKDVVYMHVSGHYLEVVTTSGSVVVLMRLADAVAALGDRGMQVHRSYWVSYHHIRDLVRRDHRMLCLADGYEIPVSRPFLSAVRSFTAGLPDSVAQSPVGD